MARRIEVGMRTVSIMLMIGLGRVMIMVLVMLDMMKTYLVRVMNTLIASCPFTLDRHISMSLKLYNIKFVWLWVIFAGTSSTKSIALTNSIVSTW